MLIGTALMRAADPSAFLRAATEPVPGRRLSDAGARVVEIKICGLRRPEDARMAVRLGARWIGVVRAPDSPRSATLEEARQVVGAAREVNPEVRPVLATGRRTP